MQDSPPAIRYQLGTASEAEIYEHLRCCSVHFVPPLETRVDLQSYAAKLASLAKLVEAWYASELVGLVAAYYPTKESGRQVFITNVSVKADYRGLGIAKHLLGNLSDNAKRFGHRQIALNVSTDNIPALQLYRSLGYRITAEHDDELTMQFDLGETNDD
ncbi:GNAT family N-acetyltransferase [Rhodopirellula sp. MGV]|uniref:GNAT family N-acetyltransferase n=1 Tax=Rhodopirellula sp. MGV TaxID=2023130 RepID=UPI000B97289E|nr:GNAT family N-acetyltransferase [Rhodopirellula sp. MGV]OYP32365.1 hypothetical protein CGZ80_20070 [Rhodopirellula sp. MGV]PNY35851.1 GNAT family N-acetyltransferase [Rhodopirellula baltica]